ncbi:hypothetical protein ACFU5O_20615 [Streptomyces sp. NPDC057445]|uniref:hypothetical protein n=1 Tax=Streptomyces sp. NPDC057445 TaxID=3346136 RepID=UPI0036BF56B8
MARIFRTRRFVTLTASTALAAGGVLVPTSAFAAPAPAHAVTAKAAVQGDNWRHGHGDKWRHGDSGGRNKGGGGGGRGNIVVIIGNNNTVPVNNGTVNTR